jgi:lipopolysaccharide export system protein LptA
MPSIYTDADGTIDRVVLTGGRAHVEEIGDDGKLVNADAERIDYNVAKGFAVLTQNATISKVESGNASGDKITYDLNTGEMHAASSPGGLVHMTIVPKQASHGSDPAAVAGPSKRGN